MVSPSTKPSFSLAVDGVCRGKRASAIWSAMTNHVLFAATVRAEDASGEGNDGCRVLIDARDSHQSIGRSARLARPRCAAIGRMQNVSIVADNPPTFAVRETNPHHNGPRAPSLLA